MTTVDSAATAPQIITADTVILDADAGDSTQAVITRLTGLLAEVGRTTDAEDLIAAAMAREAKSATGLPGGIAIPHARSASVTAASLAMARLSKKVDFGGPDGDADIVFLIAAPEGGSEHMKLLSSLARALVRPDFVAALRAAPDADRIVELVAEAIKPKAKPAPKPAATPAPAAADKGRAVLTKATAADNSPAVLTKDGADAARPRVVAITACPTGIAHTYMAADALKYAAERAEVDFVVETQGSSATTPMSAQTIADADAVIFATDVGVKGRERFAGKPVIASGVKRAINEPDKMIAEAVAAAKNPNAAVVGGNAADAGEAEGSATVGYAGQLKQALMTGVSYMIPFVAAGGLLIALGFLLAGYEIANKTLDPSKTLSDGAFIALHNSLWDLPSGGLMQYLGGVAFAVGALAMGMLVPVLAGYIAFAIADRPGIAPGFVAGLVSIAVGASFIGGLIGGLLAGVVALWLSRIPLPQWARGLQPVVIIPLFASMVVGGVMFMLLGKPLAWLTTQMTDGLNSMSGSSKIILGIVLGLMMCFDLGGPVNKAAYLFATTGLAIGGVPQLEIMAAVMAAGMVPPLALALATVLRPKLFTEVERENGKAAWLLGAAFISEGAIPFAAADPLRVIPSMMLGGATTGALIMAFGVQLQAPHGGIFVFFAMNGTWPLFLVALAAGMAVAAIAVIVAKQLHAARNPLEEAQLEAAIA